MTSITAKITNVLAGLVVASVLLPSVLASSLDSSVIRMFPKDTSELGYADLSKAREFPWFPQFASQLIPVSVTGFDQFLQQAQMRQTSSIERAAWAYVASKKAEGDTKTEGRELIVVALGHFDLDSIRSFLQSRKEPEIRAGAYTLYASETGTGGRDVFFAMIDPETIVFGPLDALRRTLAIRDGEEENLLQNQKLMALIYRANGDGIFWGVLSAARSQEALRQLVPEAAQFAEAADLIGKTQETLVTIRAPSDIDVNLQFASATTTDASLLSQLLQAGILYKRYQSREANPVLADVLDRVSVAVSANQLEVSLSILQEQMGGLIEKDIFRPPI